MRFSALPFFSCVQYCWICAWIFFTKVRRNRRKSQSLEKLDRSEYNNCGRATKLDYPAPPIYFAKELLSAAERSFFVVLDLAVRDDFKVFTKVRLADLIEPSKSGSRSDRQGNLNRITGKHVDFVLCHLTTQQVLAVVELDDKSHRRFERSMRDAQVDEALESAKIPVVRVQAGYAYSPVELREQCLNGINARAALLLP